MFEHYPVQVEVTCGEDVGGVMVVTREQQTRCGCRDDLGLDYGHPEDAVVLLVGPEMETP